MKRKPYDWERQQPYKDDLEHILDIPAEQWYKPIDSVEKAFWRGVWIGAVIEGIVLLLLIALFWGLL
jgi:hypothetical protein